MDVHATLGITFVWFFCLLEVLSQTVYPDAGRNVIPVIRSKSSRPQPYNDGTVMANVIGSAGMNFLYYFHILGVACENTDPEFYKIMQKDFEFCLNKTGPVPPQLRNKPLGSIPKPCVDWKLHRPCYKNLADDYDECLVNKPGLVKKGTDALRFTHAYAKFICGNIPDTEAHLSDRYTKKDLVVNGVFQCFPFLADRILNCIKKDKVSKTLCSKFFIVHACFGKYYNDDNCQDVQPIYYMDDLFRNMSTSLSCPGRDEHWYPSNPPPVGPGSSSPSYPPGGWTPTSQTPSPSKGWSRGWSSREEYSEKRNPWPGEQGRPWSFERDREPFIRGEPGNRGWDSQEKGWNQERNGQSGWSSHEKGRFVNGRNKDTFADSHANRPYPDTSWTSNSRPWVHLSVQNQGGPSGWASQRQYGIETSSDFGRDRFTSGTIGHNSKGRGGWSSVESGKFTSETPRLQFYSSSSTPKSSMGQPVVALPTEIFDVTRVSEDGTDTDSNKYNNDRSSLASNKPADDLGYNFYAFDK